ncbi:MAG: DegT/DnrJ/EryC1/StrS family aminotransferase [Nitrospirae bacterium]|nr:MAG: DegT/DnrJ/EryC1/StrS family aminotransferase [Nitrospirota bacterium]
MTEITKVEFFKHNIDEEDIRRAGDILRSVFLTTGSAVAEFEQVFSEYTGIPHAVGLTSCTAALHLSLLAGSIGGGDEVITTPLSFCATSNSVIHAGARPVFVDVERKTGNIDASLIEAALTEKTKAIMPVHLYGQMCDMKAIRDIADRHNLLVIEDAAHAIEARRDGVRVGELGDAACYSFYATKNITSGEGGAVCTRNKDMDEAFRMLRLHGIDKSAIDRYTRRYQHWDMPVLGWKYNMDNIHASLLIGQLRRIDELWGRRSRLWEIYEEGLSGTKGVELLDTVSGARHACHLFTVLVDPQRRDAILWELQVRGVGVAVNYRPIHLLSYYRKTYGYREGDYPVAEQIGGRTISLPLYPKMTDDEACFVIKVLKEVLNG